MAQRVVSESVRRLILEVDPETVNVTDLCRRHQVSTWFFWDLRRRADRGEEVMQPQSRAPRSSPDRTAVELEERIVATRDALLGDGFDAGSGSIWFELIQAGVTPPNESTIHRILVRRGLVIPQPNKRPRSSFKRFAAERANEWWQIDDTGWSLADGTGVKIIDVIDDASRVSPAIVGVPQMTGVAAFKAITDGANEFGLPARILSDNAKVFRDVLAGLVEPLGITMMHSRPYHPQTCGKVERFHQTVKLFLKAQPPAKNLAELNTSLNEFRHRYNQRRPHRALERQYPIDVWNQLPKAVPQHIAADTVTSVHYSRCHNGKINAGRYLISIGNRHDKQTATTIITGTTAHIFVNGALTRELEIDPAYRAQPFYRLPKKP